LNGLACPYCHGRALDLWRKAWLGPETARPCATCGKPVGVPWIAVACAVPLALAIVAAVRLPAPVGIACAVSGVASYFALQRWVVPLQGREAGP
jgi:hypothetical protein